MPVAEAVALALALADAVQHAHERGVLHCDLKPANVLLSPLEGGRSADGLSAYRPRVADFGLARLLRRDPQETRTHLLAGTPPYMAPEQALGDAPRPDRPLRRPRPGRHPLRAAHRQAALRGPHGRRADAPACSTRTDSPAARAPSAPACPPTWRRSSSRGWRRRRSAATAAPGNWPTTCACIPRGRRPARGRWGRWPAPPAGCARRRCWRRYSIRHPD